MLTLNLRFTLHLLIKYYVDNCNNEIKYYIDSRHIELLNMIFSVALKIRNNQLFRTFIVVDIIDVNRLFKGIYKKNYIQYNTYVIQNVTYKIFNIHNT